MMKELWVPLKGYEGLYEISNKGNVRSIERMISYYRNGKEVKQIIPGRPIRQFLSRKGYKQAGIYKKGKMRNVFIHMEVARAFIENPCRLPHVIHLDGNKINNEVDNLRWVTKVPSV